MRTTCLFALIIKIVAIKLCLLMRTSCHVILLKSKTNLNTNMSSLGTSRLIKYDEIVYAMKQKKSSVSTQQQTPAGSASASASASVLDQTGDTTNLNDLQKTIQNILLIEHYSRDNLQQFKMIYECNEKLKNMENEFNTLYLDEWHQQQQQQQQQSILLNANNKTLRNLHAVTSSTLRPATFTIKSINSMVTTSRSMLDNVRKHLVDYLK